MVTLIYRSLAFLVWMILAVSSTPNVYAASTSNALSKMIELSVNGDAGQSFSGDCYLLQVSGRQKRHRVSGKIPTKIWLPAQAIHCQLEKSPGRGKIILSIKRKGVQEFVQQSRYPFRWIYIASSGPWGQPTGGVSATRPTKKITQ